MNADIMNIVREEYKETRDKHPEFAPGDTVNVHYKIKEGSKERIQQFQGAVMQVKNSGTNGETFTVTVERKMEDGKEEVELSAEIFKVASSDQHIIEINPEATDRQVMIRDSWLVPQK